MVDDREAGTRQRRALWTMVRISVLTLRQVGPASGQGNESGSIFMILMLLPHS